MNYKGLLMRNMNLCNHLNEIIDVREGTIVCTDCGIVKDLYYTNNEIITDNFQKIGFHH